MREKHEKEKRKTETHVFLRNLKSIKLKIKKIEIDIEILMICFEKKLPSPVKEFMVTRPAPRRGRVERKRIQSMPFLSSLPVIE